MKSRRLDQLLSSCGYCSRSQVRFWIKAGRITVNGVVPKVPDTKVQASEVLVDGEGVEGSEGLLALYHKPPDCVCTHETREGRTIYDLLPQRWSTRNPPVTSIGRLDKDTTGLLLITDLGAFVQRLTSPKHKVPKVYETTVDRDLTPSMIAVFASGTLQLEDDESPCLPATLEILAPRQARLTLIEGRFHQVKRMFSTLGYNVTRLHRSQFGDYTLENLPEGSWKLLNLP